MGLEGRKQRATGQKQHDLSKSRWSIANGYANIRFALIEFQIALAPKGGV